MKNHILCLFLVLSLKAYASQSGTVDVSTEKVKADYYPWVNSLENGPSQEIKLKNSPEIEEHHYRVVVVLSEEYESVFIEEVVFGREGCCASIANVKKLRLKELQERFGLKGSYGFKISKWLSPTSFTFIYAGVPFTMSEINNPIVKVIQVNGS